MRHDLRPKPVSYFIPFAVSIGLLTQALFLAGCPSKSPTSPVPPAPTSTFTAVFTATPTGTATPTSTATSTGTPTATGTPTDTATATATGTPTDTATLTATSTASPTPTDTPTITFTPTATSTFTPCPNQVGKLTVGSSTGSIYAAVFWVQVPVAGAVTVTDLHARIVNPAGADAQMGIYSDNSGQPGSLLVNSPGQALVAGINDFPISSTRLSGGTTYWLAVVISGSGTISYDTGGTGWEATGYALPSTQSGGFSTGTVMDIFADTCPQ